MAEILTVDSFYENGRKGKLIGLKCQAGHITVPPRRTCRLCHSSNIDTIELSGNGEVVSYSEIYSKAKEFPISTPYTLALVKLDEGGNLLGVIRGQSGALRYGAKVAVKFIDFDNERWPRIFFDLL